VHTPFDGLGHIGLPTADFFFRTPVENRWNAERRGRTGRLGSVSVVVVGAGPVGVTAALLLARRGVDVLVLDRHREAHPQPRAVHLDDEALRVLQAAGVADDFTAISAPMAGLRLVDGANRTLAEFPRGRGEHGWPQASMFSQPDLERVLRRALSAQSRAELRGGVEVLHVEHVAGPVRLTVRDRADGTTEQLVADAVLGCDGAASTVRRLIGGWMCDLGPAERWLVVDLATATALAGWPGVQQVCDPVRPATFMPITGTRYRAEFRLREGETAADLDLRALLGRFGAADCTVIRAAEYTFAARVADRWRSGRVLLCGDAAHLTPPFIGQGLGLGLRDVHQLSWKLAAVLAGADDALLDTHQAERAPHARALVRLAVLLGRLMTGGGDRAALLRRAVLTAVRRVPRLAAFAAASRTPPLRPGPLVRRPRVVPGSPVGSLLPQPPLDGPGRLDDVLGPGWAVVTAGGPVPPDWRGRVVRVGVDVQSPELTRWLGRRSVLVRPDRIVAAVARHRRGWWGSGRPPTVSSR
jgi:3-(3-hydroxy-phenyl)propionate hydroxylase